MKLIKGGITAAKGFKAGSVHCGIKNKNKDLALIYSDVPAVAAGVFTTSRFQAAPIKVSKEHLNAGYIRAILVNSGNANSCNGRAGLEAAGKLARLTALRLRINKKAVLLASTGIIGKPLPVDKIANALPQLIEQLSYDGASSAARAIMTTDTRTKQAAVKLRIRGKTITIGAMAKGAGMISPNLATMLVFINTDVNISSSALNRALKESVASSFGLITVDGDMSTNDTVFILANGLAANPKITSAGADFCIFQKGLNQVTRFLARTIVEDAEGATKFIEITVKGGRKEGDVRQAAFKIANSPLVKIALAGNSLNWGRMLASLGSSGIKFREDLVDLYLGNLKVFSRGTSLAISKKRLKNIVSAKEVKILIDLHSGRHQVTVWSSDLTEKYVRLNK